MARERILGIPFFTGSVDEAVAAAGSVITRNVPANAIVAGNPANERGLRWKP